MKELILSTVEREFILKAIGERKRLDGRQAYDVRRMNIQFGVACGCCIVDLGDTKVMLTLRNTRRDRSRFTGGMPLPVGPRRRFMASSSSIYRSVETLHRTNRPIDSTAIQRVMFFQFDDMCDLSQFFTVFFVSMYSILVSDFLLMSD